MMACPVPDNCSLPGTGLLQLAQYRISCGLRHHYRGARGHSSPPQLHKVLWNWLLRRLAA